MFIWKPEKAPDISADDILVILGGVGAAMAAGAAAAPSDLKERNVLIKVAVVGAAAATAGVVAYFQLRKAA